jgi:uncharacterized membrane protein
MGWITVLVVFITLLLFLWLLVIDLKSKNFNTLFKRVIVFILGIALCFISNYYDHKRNEKITKDELKEIFGS